MDQKRASNSQADNCPARPFWRVETLRRNRDGSGCGYLGLSDDNSRVQPKEEVQFEVALSEYEEAEKYFVEGWLDDVKPSWAESAIKRKRNVSVSAFLSNLHHAYAQTDGTYAFPNSREGDMLKTAKREIEHLESENARLREIGQRLSDCASALLGWYSDEMPVKRSSEVRTAIRDAQSILSPDTTRGPAS